MNVIVTGGAGFVGSHMAARLVADGHRVTAYDNLSLGRREFLDGPVGQGGCTLIEADLLDRGALTDAMAGHDLVIHLAANSDIFRGLEDPELDLRQGVLATFNVLEAMRAHAIRRLIFSSSSVVYGEATVVPTPEDYGLLLPISLYGASKLACEGLISAYGHNAGVRSWIFRFGNIVGPHATHGVLLDFVRKLRADPACLEVLGDGRQAKPYLHVSDCVDGMLYGFSHAAGAVNVLNLTADDVIDASRIAQIVIETMGLEGAEVRYTGGDRGWPGDVPRVALCSKRMTALGWRARLTSQQAVERAAGEIVAQETGR
ncbi:MAG: UDP-glucose 4-epimerase [Planctomycetes bacterium SM23_25]|nr:MAG: UDP-glucose 4-epimerase [Planctomycetes bacterium SM23_25]